MHLSITAQTKNAKPAIMCVEKPIRVCIILNGTPDEADTFVTLAAALLVDRILCLVPAEQMQEFYADGWVDSVGPVLMVKELNGGKK